MVEKKRDRRAEYKRRKAREELANADVHDAVQEKIRESEHNAQIRLLKERTQHNPTDADGDIDFAYRNMASAIVSPMDAPSTSAWAWYQFARVDPIEFLKISAKREDAKAKQAGTITNQRMEDDKRQQFAIIERIEKQLTRDVEATVRELMGKFPKDVLRVCRTFDAEWKAFSESDANQS